MIKRKYVFHEKLQTYINFIKKCQKLVQENKVKCIVCGAIFSIDDGNKSDINQHTKTDQHKVAYKFQKVSDYFFLYKNFELKSKTFSRQ